MYEGLPFSATSKVVCTNSLRQIQWNFLGIFSSVQSIPHMPLKNKTRGSDDHSGPCLFHGHLWHFISVHFHMNEPHVTWTCENVYLIPWVLLCGFCFFFSDSVPQSPLPWGNWGLRAKISKAVCASVAVVISVRKDGDGIWWDLEQCESLLPRNPREDFRQNWNSHHARGVVAYSISQTRKPSCVQLGGILLSTWSLSTSFGFSKPDCLDIKPIYKPHYCSNHMALTQRYSL